MIEPGQMLFSLFLFFKCQSFGTSHVSGYKKGQGMTAVKLIIKRKNNRSGCSGGKR